MNLLKPNQVPQPQEGKDTLARALAELGALEVTVQENGEHKKIIVSNECDLSIEGDHIIITGKGGRKLPLYIRRVIILAISNHQSRKYLASEKPQKGSLTKTVIKVVVLNIER